MKSRRAFLQLLGAATAALGVGQLVPAMAAAPVRKGVLGRTYFKVCEYPPPDGYHVYLDGRDVHCEASECDLAAGWVRLYHTDGKSEWGTPRIASPPRQYVAWGKVELRRHYALDIRVSCDLSQVREKLNDLLIRFPPQLSEAP